MSFALKAQSTHTNYRRNTGTKIRDYCEGTLVNFRSLHFFRRFLLNFNRFAVLSNKKFRKGHLQTLEEYTKDGKTALETLKEKPGEHCLVALARLQSVFTVVLLQKQFDGTGQTIRYSFRLPNDPKCAFDTTQCEFLAVRWAVSLPWPWLEGLEFTVWTDHDPFKCMLYLTDSTCKLARCSLRVLEFEFDVLHSVSMKHVVADTLSRLETNGNDQAPIEDEVLVLCSMASIPRKWRGESYI